jgi:putative PIN family toxin of toxin-antitoxin system
VKVYLDTNVLVSAFATRGLWADVVRVVLVEHELVTGEVNLVELRRVLEGRFAVPKSTVHAVESFLRQQTIVPRPREASQTRLRDSDDEWVLASAEAGEVDVLVTGDRHLLEVSANARCASWITRLLEACAEKGCSGRLS